MLLDSFGIDPAEWQRIPLGHDGGMIGRVASTGHRYVACEATICKPITDDLEMQRSIVEIIATQF